MSLQVKFAILIAALAAAVLVALGAAKWALDVTYREVREPIRSASTVLSLLVDIEIHVDSLRGLLDPSDSFRPSSDSESKPPAPNELAGAFEREFGVVENLLREMNGEEWTAYAGRSATDNLSKKITALAGSSREQFQRSEGPDTGALSRQLFQIHEILKKMERRVVDDMQQLARAGAAIRSRLEIVLGLALLLVALTAALALLLVRRWVVHPVAGLRTAAARIAAGDFEHRIPVTAGRGDELTALSTEVNHMAGMVKQMQSERIEQERLAAIGEMVRRLAHNLRNPLSGIRGLAELTRSDAATLGPVGADVRETQNRIIAAVDRFEGWLADLLNVTKPAQIHAEPTDVARWLTGLVEAHRPMAQTKGVQLILEQTAGPDSATVDPRHLEHAVSAILSNAVEAAAAQGLKRQAGDAAPRVLVKSTRFGVSSEAGQNGHPAATWEIRVVDNGPGVPPDLREAIFKPYFTTKRDGNGIGLAVAQQVVRAHGGRIHVEDAETGPTAAQIGRGAAFVIQLPLDHRLAPASEVARISH